MANLKIPRALDTKVNEAFSRLAELLGNKEATISLGGNVSLGMKDVTSPDESLSDVLNKHGNLIDYMAMTFVGFNVSYYRGGMTDPKSWITDEIIVDNNHQYNGQSEGLKLQALLVIYEVLGRAVGIDGAQSANSIESVIAVHHSTLDRLESLNSDLIQTTTVLQAKLLEDARKKSDLSDAVLLKKIREAQAEFKEKESVLADEREALERREAELDNRGNTHARRELRSNMLDEVKARVAAFGVSTATVEKRRPVQVGIFILLLTLIFIATVAAYELVTFNNNRENLFRAQNIQSAISGDSNTNSNSGNLDKIALARYPEMHYYLIILRLAITSMLIFATLLFYIKWLNRWAQQHADQEFQLQRFQLDISRANWFIETCLEWKKETQSEIPVQIIERMTNGLFQVDKDNSSTVIHPADELASALVGSASKIKMKIGENEIEINPKKIPKTVESNPGNSD